MISRPALGRLLTSLAFLAAASLAQPTYGFAAEITIPHAQGETKLVDTPKTVLVFDLASLDTLDAIGVDVAGVPKGVKPASLAKFASDKYLAIGTLFEPDYEAVSAAKPDLIIVGGRSAAKYSELAKIAPTIDMTVDREHYLDSVRKNATTLGAVFGKQQEVAAKLDALDKSVAALRERAPDAGRGLIILTTGGRMSAYGPGSRFGLIHDGFGIKPAVEKLDTRGSHGQAISHEFILETNPDWLFVIDRDAAVGKGDAAQKFLDNEIVGQTEAWKKKQVVYLDPASWYLVGGGLTALQSSVDQIQAAIAKP
jgi:iron complex transport system substrate-binding protein